jgi:hypothetical protein
MKTQPATHDDAATKAMNNTRKQTEERKEKPKQKTVKIGNLSHLRVNPKDLEDYEADE